MNALPDRHGAKSADRAEHPFLDYEDSRELEAPRISPIAQIIGIARKRKWWILASILSSVIVGFIVTLLMTPLYTASATLEVQRESRNFTNVEGAEGEQQSFDPEYYQTQYGLLEARSLADKIVTSLKLSENYQFFDTFDSPKADDWFAEGKLVSRASTRQQRVAAAAKILLANVEVKPDRLSRLVRISFTSPDPALSKQIIDAWSTNFIQATLERRYEATSYARKFLEDQLSQLRIRIDESERQLVAYAAQEGIVTIPAAGQGAAGGAATSSERPLVVDDLASLNLELSQATADRIEAQSKRAQAGRVAPEILASPVIVELRRQRALLTVQYSKLMNEFTPEYEPAKAIQGQIAQIDRSIGNEEARIRRSLDDAYQSAVEREQQLTSEVGALKSGVLDQRRRSIKYNVLQREVETNRQLYDALLQRYKEIGIAGGVGVNNISVVDQAERPGGPSSPRLSLNLALALLIGAGLGIGIAFVLEQLSDSVDDPAEVSELLGVPLLGTVPRNADGDVVQALKDPKEMLSEAYFTLRAALSFTTDHGFPRSLAITSSRPAEGKSTSAYAIASSLARPERRVLLIDGDMRSPSLHGLIGISGSAGLSNYLSGSDDIQSLIHDSGQPGLFALPAGPPPPSAADLLSGDRFRRLIGQLIEHFDHVIVDAPPVMGLADAPLIASQVEGVVFVIEAHATGKSVARVSVSRLQAAHARMLGVIVSKFDTKRAHYGYGYDYGYGYGYGARDDADKA